MRWLERLRSALGGEPALVMLTDSAALGCDALELVFVDANGLQRLKLRDIRKVTHADGELMVSSSQRVMVRGAFAVESTQIKAFFADVQSLRQRREQGESAALESAFSPEALRLATPKPAPEAKAAPEIPGFSLGGSAPLEAALIQPVPIEPVPIEPSKPVIPAKLEPVPAPIPTSVQTPRREPQTDPAFVDDFLAVQPRVPKPNPRAGLTTQKESLPPPKANPRVSAPESVRPISTQPMPTQPMPTQPVARAKPLTPELSAAEPRSAPPVPAPVPIVPAPPAQVEPKRSSQPQQTARAPGAGPAPATKPEVTPAVPRRTAPQAEATPRVRPVGGSSKPASRPTVKRPDFSALMKSAQAGAATQLKVAQERAAGGLKAAQARGAPKLLPSLDWDFLRRRFLAGLIDGLAVLVLCFLVTRFFGGRELETLLRLPGEARLDLQLLNSIKDLLPPIIAGALTAVLSATVVAGAYFVGLEVSPLRATPGKRLMNLEIVDVTNGQAATAAGLGARFFVKLLLLVVPPMLGLLPTLVAMNGSAVGLRGALGLFGALTWVGPIALLVGQLPLYGGRGQSLADYLSNSLVKDRPARDPSGAQREPHQPY
jgi:uncharacterized RDD family membrane protein YckC